MEFDPASYRRRRLTGKKPTSKKSRGPPVLKAGRRHEDYQDRQIAYIKRQLFDRRPEVKFDELSFANRAFDFTMGTGSFNAIPALAQGTADAGNRIGDKITALRLVARFTIGSPTTQLVGKYRIIYFVFQQNPDAISTAVATVTNLFMSSTFDASVNIVNCPTDYDNKGCFLKLYDKSFVLNSNVAATNVVNSIIVNLDLKKMPIKFLAAGTGIVENAIYCIIVSDSATDSQFNLVQRLYYYDS